MIEIQCTSCHTRYRIDERVLPEETPTFKCSRCGHVFAAEPRRGGRPLAAEPEKHPEPPPVVIAKTPDSRTSKPLESAAHASVFVPEEPAPETVTEQTPEASRGADPANADPLAQPFEESIERDSRAGENLSFDFRDEEPEKQESQDLVRADEPDEWRVGDETPELTQSAAGPGPESPSRPRIPPAFAKPLAGAATAQIDRSFIPDEIAYIADRGKVHSAGFFIGLFFLFVLSFGVISMVISSAPAASAQLLNNFPGIGGLLTPPILPARLVALTDVKASYQGVKSIRTALVIKGAAENVGNTPLHLIRIEAALLDSAHRRLAGTSIFCGNNLAPRMISEMTPRELEFFQKLEPPKNFVLGPLAPVPFTVVFINPPATVTSFALQVASAESASSSEVAPPASNN